MPARPAPVANAKVTKGRFTPEILGLLVELATQVGTPVIRVGAWEYDSVDEVIAAMDSQAGVPDPVVISATASTPRTPAKRATVEWRLERGEVHISGANLSDDNSRRVFDEIVAASNSARTSRTARVVWRIVGLAIAFASGGLLIETLWFAWLLGVYFGVMILVAVSVVETATVDLRQPRERAKGRLRHFVAENIRELRAQILTIIVSLLVGYAFGRFFD